MTDETTEAMTDTATELHIAKRYAELGEWQEMYQHIFAAMNNVPDDARVGWRCQVHPHGQSHGGNVFGTAPDPIEQIKSMLYEYNDNGVDQVDIAPAPVSDDD